MRFFLPKPLEQRGIIVCAVGNMAEIDRIGNQPNHADIFFCDPIAVSAVSQRLVLRDVSGCGNNSGRESVSGIRSVIVLAEFGPTRFLRSCAISSSSRRGWNGKQANFSQIVPEKS